MVPTNNLIGRRAYKNSHGHLSPVIYEFLLGVWLPNPQVFLHFIPLQP